MDPFPPPPPPPMVAGDVTAQGNFVYFCSPPSPLNMCHCNLRDHVQVCNTYCADTGRNLYLAISVSLSSRVILNSVKKKKKDSICYVVRMGLFLAGWDSQLWNLCLQIRPLFNNAGCGDQNCNFRVTSHPTSPPFTEDRGCEIPEGGTVVPSLIFLSQPGTNKPWSIQAQALEMCTNLNFGCLLTLGRET